MMAGTYPHLFISIHVFDLQAMRSSKGYQTWKLVHDALPY